MSPAGSNADLSGADSVSPTIVVDQIGDYVAQLIVNDGLLNSDPDTVVLSTTSTPPTADAGADLRWRTVGGATVLGVGAVGLGAAGMWLAAQDAGDVEAPEGTREVALAGLALGVGVVLLGGGLVVTDFLLDPP